MTFAVVNPDSAECCCILCCKTINTAIGGYSYITCKATVLDGNICGHIAHIDCALRAYVAGSVGGSIGLDAEYFVDAVIREQILFQLS